jgi:hypothetical protein
MNRRKKKRGSLEMQLIEMLEYALDERGLFTQRSRTGTFEIGASTLVLEVRDCPPDYPRTVIFIQRLID